MMTLKKTILTTSLFITVLMGIRLTWMHIQSIPEQATAIQGVLDLRNVDLTDDQIVKLDGQWEFYPSELKMNASSAPSWSNSGKNYISVPGSWGELMRQPHVNLQGYGTYRLRIQINPDLDRVYGIYIPGIQNASELFINGRLAARSGTPATDAKISTPLNLPYSAYFTASGGEIEIVIQASSFFSKDTGGIFRSIQFGTVQSIQHAQSFSAGIQLMVCAILLIHTVYSFCLYWMGMHKKELLLFLALIVSTIISILVDDDKLLLVYLPIGFSWGVKIFLLSYIGISVALRYFIRQLLPKYVKPGASHRFLAVCAIYAVFVLCAPVQWVLSTSLILAMVMLYAVISLAVVTFRAVLSGGEGGVFLLLASTSVMMSVIGGVSKNFLWPDAGYYPFDITIAFVSFASFWFHRYFLTSAKTEQLAVRLQADNRQKDVFLANTSHEIRNPLHGMLNIAQAVLDSETKHTEGTNKENLELLISVGKRMSHMLNDLLDYSRLQDNGLKLQLKAVKIQSAASYVINMLQFMTEGKPIRLVSLIPDTFPMVLADENRLVQMLFNLLHNAVKYTPQGTVTIAASVEGGTVFIHIADTGIGMDKDTQQRIFQPYEQGDSELAGIAGGLGLGLSICKQLVELHGGTLQVNSSPGIGSVFTASLPLFDLDAPAELAMERNTPIMPAVYEETATAHELPVLESAAPELGSETDKKRILIVDDDPINLKVMLSLLPNNRYNTLTAGSGIEAIALLNTVELDLLITDVMMPNMSGLELTRLVRERYSMSELPVLLLTARSQPEDLYAGFLSGANDYIIKPVDALELKTRADALTNLTQSIRERLHMEAAWLQAQIQPHFLFNTLNSISALSEIDITRMQNLIDQFGNYLRASFDFQNTERVVSIQHELELVRSYVYIEQERFESRLNIRWEVDERLECSVPPLSIQTIVENAIRHGIMARACGGSICIRITDHGDYAEICVEDDGVGMDEDTLTRIYDNRSGKTAGIGLRNTDRRLKQIYGQGLRLQSSLQHGTTVSFTVSK